MNFLYSTKKNTQIPLFIDSVYIQIHVINDFVECTHTNIQSTSLIILLCIIYIDYTIINSAVLCPAHT